MTAEVAVMNKNALVFAADSATTVTSWATGEKEIRFFKGANKLFQLSQVEPVGLMINGSASMHGVPWEIVVKEFRAKNGSETCDRLSTYAEKFFDFVRSHAGLFPNDVRKKALIENAMIGVVVALQITKRIFDDATPPKPSPTKDEYLAALNGLLTEERNATPKSPLTKEIVDAAVAAHAGELAAALEKNMTDDTVKYPESIPQLAELGIRLLMNSYTDYLGSTGLVIGGYGTADFFPSFDVYECYGFLDSLLLAVRQDDSCRVVDSTNAVAIESFAITSMINTFRTGIGPDVFASVNRATTKSLRTFAEEIRVALGAAGPIPDLDAKVKAAQQAHLDDWTQQARRAHYQPLSRVIASLPLPDMAALAKSLIELQSLKERVTESTESVAGPIDVAVISKHDGFVWIERKHYFRPELNPRFLARQAEVQGKH